MYSLRPFEPEHLVHELWSSLFFPLWSQDIPECDDCPFPEHCSTPATLIRDGYTIRHPDPPHAILTWPGCPRSYVVGWKLHGCSGGVISPAEYLGWCHETGILKEELTVSGAVLAREWLRMRDLPASIYESRSIKESQAKHPATT